MRSQSALGRSGSHAMSTKPHTPIEMSQVRQDQTLVNIPDHRPPSHYNKPISVNNVSQLEVTQPGHFINTVSLANMSEHDETSPCPTHTTPLGILRRYLSKENSNSSNPQTLDADTLSSLFTSVETTGHLVSLGQAHLSSLISLFGTLSTFPPCTHIYTNPLGSNIKYRSPQTYWPFIAQMAVVKESRGWELTPSDHYWLMRADLTIVN